MDALEDLRDQAWAAARRWGPPEDTLPAVPGELEEAAAVYHAQLAELPDAGMESDMPLTPTSHPS
eukprot:9283922-Alexandrium_andersonii.AAC.1